MKIGIIGGSGLYDLEGLEGIEKKKLETPFGTPSDAYVSGTLMGVEIFFLPRHGEGHRIMPSEINHRANIFGFKMLGAERIISVSAVGSLKEHLRPRDVVLPDQYFDRTKRSHEHTFFGNGIVAHIAFAEPVCEKLRDAIASSAKKVIDREPEQARKKVHVGGTYVNMEGPAFSTKAESCTYRKLGFDVIGMTSLMEAKLCREAEMCYQAMAMVTDYDCWHESEESVSVEMLIGHLTANSQFAKLLLQDIVPDISSERDCECANALKNAIITSPEYVTDDIKKKLASIIGKYIG
ncbi:S-methyl-5'-thioadenosine phosphorylase [Verrucomicrobiota bacterium]